VKFKWLLEDKKANQFDWLFYWLIEHLRLSIQRVPRAACYSFANNLSNRLSAT